MSKLTEKQPALFVKEKAPTVNSSRPLLVFTGPLRAARLAGRRKRFLVDARDGEGSFTAHTNNTGSMLGLLRPGCGILLSASDNPARKYAHTLEMVRFGSDPGGFWVGVNTATPNRLLRAAWAAGRLPELAGTDSLRLEPPFVGGRLDALAEGPDGAVYIEAKNVTLAEDDVALFPDAPTERGRKHLAELGRLARGGTRAALFFLVQRPDASCFGPADLIDAEYARQFWRAVDAGVEVWPYLAVLSPLGVDLGPRLPLVCRPGG